MKAKKIQDWQLRTAYNVTATTCHMLGNVRIDEVKSRSRNHRISTARHIIAWVLYCVWHFSSTEIAALTERDHATVLHSIQVVNAWRTIPKAYEREINITNHFKNVGRAL